MVVSHSAHLAFILRFSGLISTVSIAHIGPRIRMCCTVFFTVRVTVRSTSRCTGLTDVYTFCDDVCMNGIHALMISDEAYTNLCELATRAGYIRGSQTARGLSAYVEHLVQCDMLDARPEYVRTQDHDMLAAGYSPEWRLYAPRRRRHLKLSDECLVDASAQCVLLGIAYGYPGKIGAPTPAEGPQCTAALLEAIGTNWIEVLHP